MTRTASEMVTAAKRRVESLTPEQVVVEQRAGPVLLVDIREPDERRAKGCIPNAVPVPRGLIEFYADPTNPYHRPEFVPTRRTIVHCALGGRSALAAVALLELGYVDVAHLDGGFASWVAAGLPVEVDVGP